MRLQIDAGNSPFWRAGHRTWRSDSIENLKSTTSLRSALRQQTREAHDTLDSAMRVTGWTTMQDYAAFLRIQNAARQPIEAFFANTSSIIDAPPAQTGLIARDLAELADQFPGPTITFSHRTQPFALPAHSDPTGAFWAIAGSSLGNRAIARDIATIAGAEGWPTRFLSDERMIRYWKALRPKLDQAASDDTIAAAASAALDVFNHFEKTVRMMDEKSPA